MGSKFKSNKYNFNAFRAVSSPPQMHIAHFVSLPSFFNFFLPKMMDQISKRTHMLRIKEATYAKIRYYLYKSEAKEIVNLINFCISRNFCKLVPKLTT